MAAKYNWALIRTGETFQSLVNTLLQFKIPGIHVFGRAGRDSGQDARSADGKTVYQCKHHSEPIFAKVLNDAAEELTKILKYRQEAHSNHCHWKGVTEWVLVTNTLVNPNNIVRWKEEIESAFAKAGLKATLWSLENLEMLLAEFPQVAGAFFEGQNRCFLSVSEAYEFIRADEIGYNGLKVGILGRDFELNTIASFLQGPKKLLWMHGPGGIGKSRLLLEVGSKAEMEGYQVLWGIEATMSQTAQWFMGINSSQKTLLLLDEPQDHNVVRVITEQIKVPNSQMKNWKVIVAVRSPNDPVLNAVSTLSANLREGPLVLNPLTPEVSKRLALELIGTSSLSELPNSRKELIAEHLSGLGGRFPIWIAMAVNVLVKHGDLSNLPHDAEDIAKKYVDEVIERASTRICTRQQLHELLRWVAIYEELDVEDDSLVSFISKRAEFTDRSRFQEALNSLVARKFVVRRGLNQRLYSIKPDVVREFIVRNWLIQTSDLLTGATSAARNLVTLLIKGFEGKPLPGAQSLVKALAKVELSTDQQNGSVDLLSPLVDELKKISKEGTIFEQQAILPFMGSFDFARLRDVLEIVRSVRLNKKPAGKYRDFFANEHELAHGMVVSELAWPLFNAARYARKQEECSAVMDEMMALSAVESESKDLSRNDGKRADSLIPRMILNENGWYPGFKTVAREKALALISKLQDPAGLGEADLNLAKIMCGPFLSIEQEHTSYNRYSLTVTKWINTLDSPEGKNRNELRKLLRRGVEVNSTPEKSRAICWSLLSSAHSSANRVLLGKSKETSPQFILDIKEDLKDDLVWALRVLKATPMSLSELRGARELWDWHFKFEDDEDIKKLAVECEAFYEQQPLAERFEVFFSFDKYEQLAAKAAEIGNKLGSAGTRADIHEFLIQAQAFAPAGADFGNILQVSEHAASHWESNSELSAFVYNVLALYSSGLEFAFAISILNRRLRSVRESGQFGTLITELQKAIRSIPGGKAKVELLSRLYSRPHPLLTGVLTRTDLQFAVEQIGVIQISSESELGCRIFASMHHVNWDKVRTLCDEFIGVGKEEDKLRCFHAIFSAVHFLDLFRKDWPILEIRKECFDWLLDLIVTLPDIDKIGEYCEHEFVKYTERFGGKDLDWLLNVLAVRIRILETLLPENVESFKLVPVRHPLTLFVKKQAVDGSLSGSDRQKLSNLLHYADRRDMLGYFLPEYAVNLDPQGMAIPGLVEYRIKSLTEKNKDSIWTWVRFAGHYAFNSKPWRQIAKAALGASKNFDSGDQISIFVALLPQGIRSSSYTVGEMDPRPGRDLAARKQEMMDETDAELLRFRQWHVDAAQAAYDRTVALYREENEE